MRGCMNCGNISCGNNKKRDCAGCGRWISPEDKIAELERENAELKEELKKWKDEWQEQVQKATDEGYARTLQTIQLTKAKEIIKIYYEDNFDEAEFYSLRKKAEQFLSEVEK